MAKFSHRLIVRYQFAHDGSTSSVVKLCHSEADAKLKEDVVFDDLKKMGLFVISSEIKETK